LCKNDFIFRDKMNFSESAESEQSSVSDWSNSSWISNYSSDFSVFVDESKVSKIIFSCETWYYFNIIYVKTLIFILFYII